MADTTFAATTPKKPRRWLRWLAGLAVGVVLLLVVAYFVVTSSAFLKSAVLPRVGAALNASITVGDASLHPFRQLVLRDLKVQPNGREPLVTADEVRVNYHLWDILHGNLRVDEIALISPTINLVQNPDGSSNLDPLLKALQAKPAAAKQPAPSAAGKPLQVDLAKLTLSHADIREIKNYAGGHRESVELTNVNVTLTNLKNGQTAKLELAADLRVENNPPTGPGGSLAASLNGNFNCSLTPDLQPGAASGSVNFAVSQAAGAFNDFNAFSTALQCDVTPTDIKQLSLQFQQAGTPLGELAVAGPFDAAKMEGRLDVNLRGIDRRLLNLASQKTGIDFGTTTVDASAKIQLAKAGADITATGNFAAAKVQLTRAGQTTPTLDFSASYDVAVDRAAEVATLRSLKLAGTQNGAPLLAAKLTSPMSLAWGSAASSVGDASLDVTLTGLNLADWKPFLGGAATAGDVGLKLNLTSHQGGKQIVFDLNSQVAHLTARLGSNQISQAAVDLSAQGQAAQFQRITLNACQAQVALQNQPALTASGSGNYDLATGAADLQVKLSAALARLLEALPQPGMSVSSGDLELNAHVTQKQKTQTLAGDLALDNFSGQIGKNNFHNYAGKFALDLANSPEQIQIHKLAGGFSQNGNAGGDFAVSGTYQPAQKSADVTVTLAKLNENALRPFLEPLLAGKRLASVSISGDVSGQYQPQGASAVKANVQVSNLVVNDPKQPTPATPLAAGLNIDASLANQTADVRQLQIALTPTVRATNQLQFSGQVDFSKPDAIQGQLKLAADSLDLTSYYDLFSGGTNAAAKTATASTASPAGANQEPAAVKLPLKNFTLAADIGRLYLHEVAVTNFQTTVQIDGGHIVVKPLQFALNGAPVNATADLDLGVPGYQYNVSFDAQAVPLAPLVDSFQPARAGQLGGTLTASAQITGAGVTGASLQKNLAGQVNLGLTNLNLSVINVQSRLLKSVINVVATVPQLLSNPEAGLASLLSGITGQGGLMNELQQSPIQTISVNLTAGNGRVNLQPAVVQSSAFEADATGDVALDAVLTNSVINIPVTVLLSQDIAKKLNLTATTTGSASAGSYVPLPQFLTMRGTLGDPKPDINKLALAGTAVKSLGGSLLNLSGTNASPVGNLLNQLLKLPK